MSESFDPAAVFAQYAADEYRRMLVDRLDDERRARAGWLRIRRAIQPPSMPNPFRLYGIQQAGAFHAWLGRAIDRWAK